WRGVGGGGGGCGGRGGGGGDGVGEEGGGGVVMVMFFFSSRRRHNTRPLHLQRASFRKRYVGIRGHTGPVFGVKDARQVVPVGRRDSEGLLGNVGAASISPIIGEIEANGGPVGWGQQQDQRSRPTADQTAKIFRFEVKFHYCDFNRSLRTGGKRGNNNGPASQRTQSVPGPEHLRKVES
ncbi:MAG TPA: hypothetical protein DCE44_19200, partial [Verrucomicrobiales bacterium]|nr:hypothetical protein [Verrucomicrobiales bacterium]